MRGVGGRGTKVAGPCSAARLGRVRGVSQKLGRPMRPGVLSACGPGAQGPETSNRLSGWTCVLSLLRVRCRAEPEAARREACRRRSWKRLGVTPPPRKAVLPLLLTLRLGRGTGSCSDAGEELQMQCAALLELGSPAPGDQGPDQPSPKDPLPAPATLPALLSPLSPEHALVTLGAPGPQLSPLPATSPPAPGPGAALQENFLEVEKARPRGTGQGHPTPALSPPLWG